MQDVCPQPLNHYACGSVMSAWGGGDYDQNRNRMIIYGGGHGDSWYNHVFSFDLVSMKWARLSEMPGDYASEAPSWWRDIKTESCGYYTKGTPNLPDSLLTPTGYVNPDKCFQEPVLSQLDLQQPRSIHTYGGVAYDRIGDRYCVFSTAGTFPSGQAAFRALNCFNPDTHLWARVTDIPDGFQSYRNTAVDAAGNIWTVPIYNGNIAKFNPVTNSWSTAWYSNYESTGTPDIDRKRNVLTVLMHDQPTGYIRRWNLNSLTDAGYTAMATSGEAPPITTQIPGFVYADSLDRFYAWTGGKSVYVLDPSTGAWTRKAATGDDPGAPLANGTYNRFRFVQSRGVFILANGTDKNVLIYKP